MRSNGSCNLSFFSNYCHCEPFVVCFMQSHFTVDRKKSWIRPEERSGRRTNSKAMNFSNGKIKLLQICWLCTSLSINIISIDDYHCQVQVRINLKKIPFLCGQKEFSFDCKLFWLQDNVILIVLFLLSIQSVTWIEYSGNLQFTSSKIEKS